MDCNIEERGWEKEEGGGRGRGEEGGREEKL